MNQIVEALSNIAENLTEINYTLTKILEQLEKEKENDSTDQRTPGS